MVRQARVFLLFFFLWEPAARVRPEMLVLGGLFFLAASVLPGVLLALDLPMETVHWSASLSLLAPFAVLLAQILRTPRAGRSLSPAQPLYGKIEAWPG